MVRIRGFKLQMGPSHVRIRRTSASESAKISMCPSAYKGPLKTLPVDPFNDRLGYHLRPDSESLGPPRGEGLALFPWGVGVTENPTRKKVLKSDVFVRSTYVDYACLGVKVGGCRRVPAHGVGFGRSLVLHNPTRAKLADI